MRVKMVKNLEGKSYEKRWRFLHLSSPEKRCLRGGLSWPTTLHKGEWRISADLLSLLT